jgi:DNA-binding CsgD family transcriptional regulator
MLGYVAQGMGDTTQAEELSLQAIEVRGRSEVGWHISEAQTNLGLTYLARSELDKAVHVFEESQAAWRKFGDAFDVALTLGYLALARTAQGRYRDAAIHLIEALPLWQGLKNQENISEWLLDVAVIAERNGQAELGAKLAGASSTIRSAISHGLVLPERAIYERSEASLRASMGDDAFDRAWLAGAAIPVQQAISDASAFLVQVIESSEAASERKVNQFGLTAREQDVLRLLINGQPDKEIAEALFVGQRTVETHVSNLLAKLGARNRAEAAAIAVREGLP